MLVDLFDKPFLAGVEQVLSRGVLISSVNMIEPNVSRYSNAQEGHINGYYS